MPTRLPSPPMLAGYKHLLRDALALYVLEGVVFAAGQEALVHT
ncbi:MAG TPA: hypothetical protein VGV40_01595 [Solirubrobacteraceae bacterium]|nr:hypothetical protein [Solirubrobacteraceae bacterium]